MSAWRICAAVHRVSRRCCRSVVFLAGAGLLSVGVARLAAQDDRATTERASLEVGSAGTQRSTKDGPHIEQWIHDLAADRFVVREAAMMRLREAGRAAIDALAAAADSDRLEASARSLTLLEEFAQSDEDDLSTMALERIVALENRPVASARAFDMLAQRRERVARAQIAKFGGILEAARNPAALQMGGKSVTLGKAWRGGDEGVAVLADIRNLVEVNVCEAPITDQGLAQLSTLPALMELHVLGTNASAEAIQDLRRARPQVKLIVRQVFLGVKGKGPALIDEVLPNTAAARAGLLPGDVIVNFNGAAIKTFQQLVEEIGKCSATDEPRIELRRGGTVLTKTIRFHE